MSDKLIEDIERVARHHVGSWVKEQHPELKNLFVAAEQDIRGLAKALAALLSPARDEALEEARGFLSAARINLVTASVIIRLLGDDKSAGMIGKAADQVILQQDKMDAAIRALKSAQPSPAPSVPEGWQLVPKYETQEMIEAGKVAAERNMLKPIYGSAILDAYRAMLAAAPTPDDVALKSAPAPQTSA